jgi:hypothetical protein
MTKTNKSTDYSMEMMMEDPEVKIPLSFPSEQAKSQASGRRTGGQASARRAEEGQAFLRWVQGLTSTAFGNSIVTPAIPMPAIPMPAIPMPEIPMPAIDIDELMIKNDFSAQEELHKSTINDHDHYPYLEKLENYVDIKFLYKNTRGKPTENNLNSLHLAAINGETKAVEDILKQGVIISTEVPFYKLTPLHLAALNGYTETVEVLLANGADTKMLDRMHRTASELAGLNGHSETAEKIEEYNLNKRLFKIINLHKNKTSNLPTYAQNGVGPDIFKSVDEMLKAFDNKRKLDNQTAVKEVALAGQAKNTERNIKRRQVSSEQLKRSIPIEEVALDPVASEDTRKPSADLKGRDPLLSNSFSTQMKNAEGRKY